MRSILPLLLSKNNGFIAVVCVIFAFGCWMILEGTVRRNIMKGETSVVTRVKYLNDNIKLGGERRYLAMRTFAFWVLVAFSLVMMYKDLKKGLLILAISLIVWWATNVDKKLFKGRNFYEFLQLMEVKMNEKAYNRELYDIVVQMKNLLVSNGDTGITAHYVIKRLLPYTNKTKHVFSTLASRNMKDEGDMAMKEFQKFFGSKLAGDFAYIIRKLDTLTYDEYMPLVDTLLANFKEEEETRQVEESESRKNQIFLLASGQVIVLIGNLITMIFINTIGNVNLIY